MQAFGVRQCKNDDFAEDSANFREFEGLGWHEFT